MSEATRYTIFFVLSFVTFTAWGMITHDLRGTVWYWAAGVLLAGLSEVWFRQVKKNIRRESAAAWLFPVRSDDDLFDRSLFRLAAAS